MISSRQNRRIKTIRGLKTCKEEFAFLEGPHLIEEVIDAGLEFLEVLATREFLASESGQAIGDRLVRPPLVVTTSVLTSITDTGAPQGVLAVAEVPRTGVKALPSVPGGIYLFLDRVQDPGNLGALVRSAEATSVAGIALAPGCAHPNNPKALRASAGSLLRTPVAMNADVDSVLAHLSTLSPALVALDPDGGDDLYETALEGSLILALGSEGSGLPAEVRSRADLRITIPVAEPVESLNVAVAASIVLHELARRRRAAP